jgi:hypothetical protein
MADAAQGVEAGQAAQAAQAAQAEQAVQAAQAAQQAAQQEAAVELLRLLALERREEAATGVLRGVLDARYLGMRRALTSVVSGAALYYDGGWDAAALCMALLDAWRAAAGPASELAAELAAVGLLAAAVSFVRDPACSAPGESSLRLLAERWAAQAARLSPRMRHRLGARPAALDALCGGSGGGSGGGWSGGADDGADDASGGAARRAAAAIRAAQAAALATLDWRVVRTTAGALLEAMAGAAPQDARVEATARKLCAVGLLRGSSLFYGQAVLAAASLRAARTLAGVAPAWPAALAAFAGVSARLAGAEAEHCARDLLHAEAAAARGAPRTPRPPRKRRARGGSGGRRAASGEEEQ